MAYKNAEFGENELLLTSSEEFTTPVCALSGAWYILCCSLLAFCAFCSARSLLVRFICAVCLVFFNLIKNIITWLVLRFLQTQ